MSGPYAARMRRVFLAILLLLSSCSAPGSESVTTKVTPTTLSFTSRARSTVMTLKNNSEGSPVTFTLAASTPRIRLEPAKGSLAPGQTAYVNVSFAYKGLSKGQLLNETLTLSTQSEVTGSVTKTVPLVFEMTVGGLDACGGQRSGSSVAAGPRSAQPSGLPYAPGELLVQYRPGLSVQGDATALRSVALGVARDYGLEVQGAPSPSRPTLVTVPEGEAESQGETLLELAARLARDPRVAYAEPNYYLELLGLPDDPFVNDQWNLLEFGLPEAWAVETGTGKVTIAVIDSGVYGKHEDLSGKLYPGCDFYDGDSDAAPGLDSGFEAGHGTHVAGIAAALGNNALGVAGVAYGGGVRLLPVKVFDDVGTVGTVDELLDGLLWAAGIPLEGVATNPHPADIINMSLGIDTAKLSGGVLQSIDEVTKRVLERGVVMFAASGNNGFGDRIFAPASSPSVYAVGSVDGGRGRSAFSNYALTGATVDFMAPGGENPGGECFSVLSTFPLNDYVCQSGTSMASPFVAGVAALLLSRHPDLSPAQLKARLAESAFFDPAYMNPKEYGHGVVCADKALGAPTRCGR